MTLVYLIIWESFITCAFLIMDVTLKIAKKLQKMINNDTIVTFICNFDFIP